MSGPQHIAWYETARRELGGEHLAELQIRMARSDHYFDALELRDRLEEMSRGKPNG